MMNKRLFLCLLMATMLLLCSFSASAFIWVGYIKNSTGQYVGGANVSIQTIQAPDFETIISINSTTTNASGYFTLEVDEGANRDYRPVIRVYQGGSVVEVGPTLPDFPVDVYTELNETSITTQEAVTINITMYINNSNNITNCSGMLMDSKLGFPVGTFSDVNGTLVYAPANRNYTIIIWGKENPPKTFTINNISSYSSPKRIDFKENRSISFYSLTGYASVTENSSGVNFTGYYLYGFVNNGVMLGNAYYHAAEGDNIDSITGFYNITVPSGSPYLLAVFANDTKYYAGFLNVTMTQNIELNTTLRTLAGIYHADNAMANTSKTTLAFYDGSTGAAISGGGFVEISTTYNSVPIKWYGSMTGTNMFNVSLWNSSSATITIFNSNYAPRKYRASTAALNANNATISIGLYSMNITDDEGGDLDMNMVFYKSNSTCDVISPPAGCLVANFSNDEDFSPMQAMFGGSVSMRFVQDNDVVIHYTNVDLLASGPPDIMMTPNGANTTSGSALESAWKFGSKGPDTYDYILIGVPYNPATMNENADINISIPILYDEGWNVLWNTSSMGTSVNLSDYTDYKSQWFTSAGMKCIAAANLSNSQNCSLDTTNNMIWLRLPHFSAVGPKLKGSVVSTTTPTTTANGGLSAGGMVVSEEEEEATETPIYTGSLEDKDTIKFTIGGEEYSFSVLSVGSNGVQLEFSTGEVITVKVGESAYADVTGDGVNDVKVFLNSIKDGKAYVKVSKILKEVVTEQPAVEVVAEKEEAIVTEAGELHEEGIIEEGGLQEEKLPVYRWIGIAVVLVALLLLAFLLYHKKKRKHH